MSNINVQPNWAEIQSACDKNPDLGARLWTWWQAQISGIPGVTPTGPNILGPFSGNHVGPVRPGQSTLPPIHMPNSENDT